MRHLSPPVALGALLLLTAAPAAAQFTEDVTFSFRADQITYSGPITSAWLMLDVDGGRNRVADARSMSCDNGSPKRCSLTVPLAEGDYIYVYVANPEQFVDMSDPLLNPDDIPDSNFFRDPSPRTTGFCGQFSTDNCLQVRNPDRPRFDPASFQPGHGALVTTDPVQIEAAVLKGANGRALDGASVQVSYEDAEPPAVRYNTGAATMPNLVNVAGASFSATSSGGTVHATIAGLPEGFHRIYVTIANTDGLASDPLAASLVINRSNGAPVAVAGPTLFAEVNQEVVLDGSASQDPDGLGFTEYQWRVVEAPGGGQGFFRCVDDELIPRDGFGKVIIDEHGNPQGDACTRGDPGAVPRFRATVPGRYVVGLRVRDVGAGGGTLSAESTTEVHVVSSFNLTKRPRLEVVVSGDTITVDGSLTVGGGSASFVADGANPAPITLSPSGLVATFSKPSVPGAYFVHLSVDDSYPATAMVRVLPDGAVDGFDLGRPPRAWKNGEKVIYLGFVREFFDADGDGEGDLLGMIDKVDAIAALGVTTVWLMPLVPGPTTHGYATTGPFAVEEDYGSAEDLELLCETAKAFGLEIVMDFVANHTSDQHPFFQAARQNPSSPMRDWYAFNPDGSYRYAFTFYALPDNNQNSPLVRQTLTQVVDWFFDRGISGVRADIAGFTPPSYWRALRRHLKERNPDAIMLAELLPPQAEYFVHGFDLAYDPNTYWNTRDAFAVGGNFDGVDSALEDATRFVEHAASERARATVRQDDVLFMRYIDNQDEDRFLLRAGGDLRKAKSVAGFLLTVPGAPLVTYGNEVGIEELRGRYPFSDYDDERDRFGDSARNSLREHYRKLITVRKGNRALHEADTATGFADGNSYLRVSSNGDDGGGNVYSFLRFAAGQRFLVMVNRADSTALGTTARVYPPPQLFTDFPDQTLVLVDHLDPGVRVSMTKAQLAAAGGTTFNVPGFGTRVLQVTRNGIPDDDDDGTLDSYDNCLGIANATQSDLDGDGVGDRCDHCAGTLRGTAVGRDGCGPNAGALRPRLVLEGALEDQSFEVASGSGIHLWAAFNGQELYVATEAAARGHDVFLLVTDNTGRTSVAPFGKAGSVATDGIFLADEGENDFARWFGNTGEGQHGTEPLPGRGALEGTLNLVEEFGAVPPVIYLAAVRYGGDDDDGILAQAPAGNGNDIVEASELFALDTAVPALVPVGSGEGEGEGEEGEGEGDGPIVTQPGDVDGDGTENLVDNCPELYNAAQTDTDHDGLGDGCDQCPLTAPGVVPDSRGCGERETPDPELPRANPRVVDPEDRLALERECGCTSAGDAPAPAALALLGIAGLLLTRRRR
ncbi:MAG: MYXO-CTERM sorting domain-containing protein [Deltaproteobacteria bacterium]|nr:MYXO-CTERM sorting domain-containing protein [Deltaproteobacteria bacterium]